MKWIALIAAVLQFLAFWFAAPELLGENTLKRFERGLNRLFTLIPMIAIPAGMVVYGGTFLTLAFLKIMKAQDSGIEVNEMTTYYVSLAIGTAAYFWFILRYKRIKQWLEQRVSKPLVEQLIHRSEVRKNALVIGAVLFSLGFILQVITIVLSS